VIFRFASPEHLRNWEDSPSRAEHLARGEDLVRNTDIHKVTGLETWFELPGRTAPAPPRWKMFVVSVTAIYLLQLAGNLLVGGFGLSMPVRVLVITVGVTSLMTWLVMPHVARVLQDWLYAPLRRR
jgi:antibiotic biosynthesis monooxygenase (ABM) superfamily enzyme